MKLFIITQNINCDYDTFDAAVVAAPDAATAVLIHPSGRMWDASVKSIYNSTWTDPENVRAIEIGTASENQKQGVILASFNAG